MCRPWRLGVGPGGTGVKWAGVKWAGCVLEVVGCVEGVGRGTWGVGGACLGAVLPQQEWV